MICFREIGSSNAAIFLLVNASSGASHSKIPQGEILNMHLADATGQPIDQIAKVTSAWRLMRLRGAPGMEWSH